MNEKLEKFAKLCASSRQVGLTLEEHEIKKQLANELHELGILNLNENGSYDFVNEYDYNHFLYTIYVENCKNNY